MKTNKSVVCLLNKAAKLKKEYVASNEKCHELTKEIANSVLNALKSQLIDGKLVKELKFGSCNGVFDGHDGYAGIRFDVSSNSKLSFKIKFNSNADDFTLEFNKSRACKEVSKLINASKQKILEAIEQSKYADLMLMHDEMRIIKYQLDCTLLSIENFL